VALLDDLSAQEEARLEPKPPWTRAKMSPGRFEAMTRAIVGVRLTVERLEGTSKLSQNKSEADRGRVIAALGDHPIGRLMRG
jgi:transcriptional regulator